MLAGDEERSSIRQAGVRYTEAIEAPDGRAVVEADRPGFGFNHLTGLLAFTARLKLGHILTIGSIELHAGLVGVPAALHHKDSERDVHPLRVVGAEAPHLLGVILSFADCRGDRRV